MTFKLKLKNRIYDWHTFTATQEYNEDVSETAAKPGQFQLTRLLRHVSVQVYVNVCFMHT